MRVVEEIVRPESKITIFSWNGKFIIKFEQDVLEQTYKVSELDLTSEADVKTILSEAFIATVEQRFAQMRKDFYTAMDGI
ncbi:hypothetical protein SAMN05421780_106226 [Flexibacter flexilis DSM 6793]|uniref:Uncharacterized protein n=1 Tax=Flexibacter flexilis DSM 6793 TaxID=927664 RepID=A0A1I1K936_9BACT|nr:hypothetical protein [Flexibacter flexilis]SFC55198.1 hypothetical protein SAMN05421780_106226 [Flexibacter flexilis DSM 6793]